MSEKIEFSDRVLSMLLNCGKPEPTLASVAGQFDISPSTLRRWLGDDGARFGDLHNAARLTRCNAIMRAGKPPPAKVMADQLGYTEANSFLRAYRGWTGKNYSKAKLEVQKHG